MDDKVLFHGSRSGLHGSIAPISRPRTDFGKGFYLGTNDLQAKGLVRNEKGAVLYTVLLKLSEIPEDRILTLAGEDWVYTVMANRGKCGEFNKLNIAQEYLDLMDNYDVIIGPIADDRMNASVNLFARSLLSDAGLLASLGAVDYGCQYVLKTPYACSKAEIIDEHKLTEEEKKSAYAYNVALRKIANKTVNDVAVRYRHQGTYLDEIIQREHLLEKAERSSGNYDR